MPESPDEVVRCRLTLSVLASVFPHSRIHDRDVGQERASPFHRLLPWCAAKRWRAEAHSAEAVFLPEPRLRHRFAGFHDLGGTRVLIEAVGRIGDAVHPDLPDEAASILGGGRLP